MEENYAFAGVIPRSHLHFMPYACFFQSSHVLQKTHIGLAPRDEYTERVAENIVETWKRYRDYVQYGAIIDIKYKYFDSKEDMFAYVEHDQYMTD